jgi:hypothetical protein
MCSYCIRKPPGNQNREIYGVLKWWRAGVDPPDVSTAGRLCKGGERTTGRLRYVAEMGDGPRRGDASGSAATSVNWSGVDKSHGTLGRYRSPRSGRIAPVLKSWHRRDEYEFYSTHMYSNLHLYSNESHQLTLPAHQSTTHK